MFFHVHPTLNTSNISFDEKCKLKGKQEKEKKKTKKSWCGQGSNFKPSI